jgi:hypothetical protein
VTLKRFLNVFSSSSDSATSSSSDSVGGALTDVKIFCRVCVLPESQNVDNGK